MQNFSIVDYLKINNTLSQELFDPLKFELDKRIYYYGKQFRYPQEAHSINYFSYIIQTLKYIFILYRIAQSRSNSRSQKVILSNAYFTVNEELEKLQCDVFCPSWSLSENRNVLTDLALFIATEKIKSKLKNNSFYELISPEFLTDVKTIEAKLKTFYQKIKLNALMVPNDISFFENISIRICKDINVPSFVFLHGIPGVYNNIDNNRTDYLIVWGDKIKVNYVNAGVSPGKIFVSGHPYYKKFKTQELRHSLDNVLLITKSMNGAQHGDIVRLSDRGNLVLYLYSVEKVLKKLGVKSVRFRPHPSENAKWYLKFINNDFYRVDNSNLETSIRNSSLVIGPTSTVFLESIYYGVNYLVYEPEINKVDLINFEPVPPFDGSDGRIPVAKNEEELEYLLKHKEKVNASFFPEYIQTPFNLTFIKELI